VRKIVSDNITYILKKPVSFLMPGIGVIGSQRCAMTILGIVGRCILP
jgi:hypothetical protein